MIRVKLAAVLFQETAVKRILLLSMLSFSASVLAQAPVEERVVPQRVQTQTQLKGDFARQEKDKARDRVHQAEQTLEAAQDAQARAAKQFELAQQERTSAQAALEKSQAEFKQAEARAAQTERDAEQAWRK